MRRIREPAEIRAAHRLAEAIVAEIGHDAQAPPRQHIGELQYFRREAHEFLRWRHQFSENRGIGSTDPLEQLERIPTAGGIDDAAFAA
jgi:hypothetical protein